MQTGPDLRQNRRWRLQPVPRARAALSFPVLAATAILWILAPLLAIASPAHPEFEGKIIRKIEITSTGPLTRISPADLAKLVVLKEGQPYTATAARNTILRLYSAKIFYDVQVRLSAAGDNQVDVHILLIGLYYTGEVNFKDDTAIDLALLRRELPFRVGEAFSDTQMEEAQSRLKAVYQNQGYYQATLKPEYELQEHKAQVDVTFHVEAGKQATVAEMKFDVEGQVDMDAVHKIFKTHVDGKFSEAQLESEMKDLDVYFALQGYLDPDIYIKEGPTYYSQTNSVKFTVRIVPRTHTDIVFEGVELSDKEKRTLPLFNHPGASIAFLEESANQLTEQYQSDGYFMVKVKHTTSPPGPQPDKIVISVDKGKKYDVSAILFQGGRPEDQESLEDMIQVKKAGLFSRGKLTDSLLSDDTGRIQSYYQSQGFMNAKADYQLEPGNPSPGDLTVVYKIDRGDQFLIEDVSISGEKAISAKTIRDELQAKPGVPFSPLIVATDRSDVMALYENRGYRDTEFRSEVSYPKTGRVRIKYLVDEGSQVFVGDVIVTGNLETRESVVREQIHLSPGQPLSLERMLLTETDLYNLAVFNRVQVDGVRSYVDAEKQDLLVDVTPAKKFTLLYGIGYSSYEGPRGTFGISDINFLGMARPLSLGLRAGRQRQRGTLSYTIPRFFIPSASALLSLTVDNEKALTQGIGSGFSAIEGRPFNSLRYSASGQIERHLSQRESLFFRLKYEDVKIGVPIENVPLEFFRVQPRLKLSSYSASYLNDSRNNASYPTGGFFVSGDVEVSSRLIGSNTQFLRVLTQGQYYRPLFSSVVWASSLRIGTITPYGKTAAENVPNAIPISERFFSGGATTLRGVPQDLAGPLLRDSEGNIVLVNNQGVVVGNSENGRPVPLGGNALLIANNELRFPLASIFSGAVFYDIGNVFENVSNIIGSSYVNAVGFGLRINTPVGPVRFDVGYNPNPPPVVGYSHVNFYFTLGNPF